MKKIINTAPMAVVTTLHTPPTLSLTLKPVGDDATLTQAQDVAKNMWLPDRTIKPLFIVPVFDAYDPDKQEHIAATPSYTWYVNDVVVPSSNTSADDYYIITVPQPDAGIIVGTLVVRKNTSYLQPITIKCVATYQTYTEDSEVLLTSENKPDVFYRVNIKTPPVVEYRPLTDDSSQKQFQAFVQHGDEALVWDDEVGKSINAVDLYSLTWSKSDSVFTASLPSAPKTTGGAVLAGYEQSQSLASDKTISTSNGNIRVKDSTYSSAADFKTAMFGKVLFYELATKTVQESFEDAMRKMTGFFWYLDGQLITSDTYGYVSGQGMETLVLDADYIDGSTVSVRLAIPTFTDNGVTMPTSPTGPACSQSYLTWSWDDIDVMAIALGGSLVHQYSGQKKFVSVARVNGKDMPASKRSHIRAVWYTHDTDASSTTKVYYGDDDGTEKPLPASALWRTGKVNVEVGLELYLLGYQHVAQGGSTLTRTQTKIENKAPLCIIHSSNSALTVSLTLKPVGDDATLTQAQDVTKNLWLPDRTIKPLFLVPVFDAYDEDAKQSVTITPMLQWFVNDVLVPYTNTASSDYYIMPAGNEIPAGTLVVRKNTNYNSPDVIRCVATYADCLNTQTLTKDAEVLLTTENKPEAVYMLDIAAPAPIVFRPFSDTTSQMTIPAIAQYGDTRLHDEVRYFWYVDGELIDDETVGYISGQGSETLVIDLDYFKDMTISVRIGVPVSGVMPSEPNINAESQRLITWDYEDVQFMPIGYGGNAVRESSGDKFFEAVVKVNGKDISKEKMAKYTRMKWFTHDTNADADDLDDKGWGPSLTLAKSEMYRSESVNVEVGIEPYVLGEFKAVTDIETGAVVIDEETGKVVVMND